MCFINTPPFLLSHPGSREHPGQITSYTVPEPHASEFRSASRLNPLRAAAPHRFNLLFTLSSDTKSEFNFMFPDLHTVNIRIT